MGLDTYETREPRDRLGAYLRRAYRGEHMTKRLASDIGCTPKAAENMLCGHWPGSRHFAAIVRRFGRDVVSAVFDPEIDAVAARLQGEIRELEEALERTRAAARAAEDYRARLDSLRRPSAAAEGAAEGQG